MLYDIFGFKLQNNNPLKFFCLETMHPVYEIKNFPNKFFLNMVMLLDNFLRILKVENDSSIVKNEDLNGIK